MSMICLIFGQLKFLISRDLLGSAGLAIGVLNLAIVVPQVAYSSQILHDHLVSFIYLFILISLVYMSVHIATLMCNLVFDLSYAINTFSTLTLLYYF